MPRCLYPDPPKTKLLTVPACYQCNNALAKDEEYFRTVLTAHWIENRAARQVWQQKVRASFNRGWNGLRELLAANAREIWLPSPKGFVRTAVASVDAARMNRVAEKMVRGLYYHVTGRIMPAEATMQFHWRPSEWLPDTAMRARLINVDPQVFSCRYGIACESSPEVSIWWMLFYRSLMYVVTTEALVG